MEIASIDRATDGVCRHGPVDTLWENERTPKVAICSEAARYKELQLGEYIIAFLAASVRGDPLYFHVFFFFAFLI